MDERDRPEQPEAVEAERLAGALDALDAGRDPGLDPREDPQLSSLVETSGLLRRTWNAVTPSPDYITRSRALILRSMGRPAERALVVSPRPVVLPFYRRWNILAPVASAAAAAAVAFAVAIATFGGGATAVAPALVASAPAPESAEPARPPFVANFVALSVDQELSRLAAAISEISERSVHGKVIDAVLFRVVSDSSAAIARYIANSPDQVSKDTVVNYFQTSATGQAALSFARPRRGDETALYAAQAVGDDGILIAGRYLVAAQADE